MNLDSIHRLIEETQIFRMQPSSVKTPRDLVAPASAPRGPCDSCWPLTGLQPQAAPRVWAPSRHTDEWDVCEELRLRELEEAKARAAQMEKTMRWWSDCTANWREKWSKVRAERNSAREEGRQLRVRLEMAVKELSALKKRQSSLEAPEPRGTQDQKRPSVVAGSCAQRDEFQVGRPMPTGECLVTGEFSRKDNTNNMEEGLVLDPLRPVKDMNLCRGCSDSLKNPGSANGATGPGLSHPGGRLPLEREVPEISALQGHWEDFQRILRKERELRSSLEKEIERLESAVALWKRKYEELKESMLKNRKELNALHGQPKNELAELSEDVKERAKPQEGQGRGIYESRAELQDQNPHTTEIPTEDPDIKESDVPQLPKESKLHAEYDNAQKIMEELLGLQHAYHKLSRQYQAKIAEVTRAHHRADQNAAEGKKLKFQVEELKERLNQKEDKLSDALNQICKLQRLLDDQKEAKENLETELRHLQNR